jgi:hypothetical protein
MIVAYFKYFDTLEWGYVEIEVFANSLIEAQATFDDYIKNTYRFMSEKEFQENLQNGYFKIRMDRFEEIKIPSIGTVRNLRDEDDDYDD